MISVIIPVLNESESIASVIHIAKASPNVTEVIVVDDGSIDGTPEIAKQENSKVILSTLLGKGASMEDGMRIAQNEILVYLDGDLIDLNEKIIRKITSPIINNHADLVKANFSRDAGRVTILTARPLLSLFFPELNNIGQPLGGIIAIRRSLMQKIRLETDFGVDIGILIDVLQLGARIKQVDIGLIKHINQSLDTLGDMAKQITRVIFHRAHKYNRFTYTQVQEIEEIERHTQAEFTHLVDNISNIERLALFDMDGVLVDGRFIQSLAEYANKTDELNNYLDNYNISAEERTQQIASLFAGITKNTFEKVAQDIPIMKEAHEVIIALRKKGYTVGIVTDSFRVASEIIRRRVFADFSIAHFMRFKKGVATGNITLSSAMMHPDGCKLHKYCKLNVMLNLTDKMKIDKNTVLAVGDNENDICLLKACGQPVGFRPKIDMTIHGIKNIVHGSLAEILTIINKEKNITKLGIGRKSAIVKCDLTKPLIPIKN